MAVRKRSKLGTYRIRRILHEFRQMPFADRFELFEAIFWLLAARQALRYIPFSRLVPRLSQGIIAAEIIGPERTRLCLRVRWLVLRASHCFPGEFVCFPRAIAAQGMLRRRRVGTELYYGATVMPEIGLKTHVWLQDGTVGVVGYGAAEQYRVLACYHSSG